MKLYRFVYSNYSRKVQTALELAKIPFETVDVAYGDRAELVAITGGMHVPVLIHDDGRILRESRAILDTLSVEDQRMGALVPPHLAAPVWAYSDWADGPLEDVLFRIASPGIHDALATPVERAWFTVIKERRWGAGAVEAWVKERPELVARARAALAPTLRTLARVPFIIGDRPTLADAALYGHLAPIAYADPALVDAIAAGLGPWVDRMHAAGVSAFPRRTAGC
jgi:glutathione S-transferase